MSTERTTLTTPEISAYFARLELPPQHRHHSIAGLDHEETYTYLSVLQQHHLASIPFENLSLHYSAHRAVPLHPKALFQKIIADENGRGGYCMENNCLFGTLLLSLGFTIYSGGARVFDGASWTGWSHMVNMVTIGETKYHVDVGFGSDGPVVPMPLERSGTIQHHISPGSARLQWRNIPGNRDPNQRLWVYEYRRDDDSEWEIKYSYTELEFQPRDYAVMNYFTSTSQRTFFTRMVVAEKKIMGDDGVLIGKLTLSGNNMKWRIHGKMEKELEFQSEEERLNALEKYFGIKFGDADKDGIRGLPSEIK